MYDPAVRELLLEREAKGLQAPAIARIGFALFGGISALDGIPSVPTVVAIWLVVLISVAVNIAFIRALRRRQYVNHIGWLGVGLDVAIILTYPVITSAVLGSHDLHWAYALKGLIVLVFITLVAINGLALRPAYPTVVGASAIGIFAAMFVVATFQPSITWAEAESFTGPTISSSSVLSQVIFLIIVTVVVHFLTRFARSAVIEATLLHAEHERIMRAHAASVMEGRLDALRNLVASLSHEMNTPLGAIKSAVTTIKMATDRLPEVAHSELKSARLLGLIDDTSQIPLDASERLSDIMHRLNTFAALDSADADLVSVNDTVDRTLSLIPPQLIGRTAVELDLHARTRVRVSGPRLNLAMTTIVTNAFEAVGGSGRVRLRTEEDDAEVRIVVTDDGPGIAPAKRKQLFDFRFERTADRVKAGLGLPAAYSLIRKHGGDIRVESTEGKGTTFVVALPRTP